MQAAPPQIETFRRSDANVRKIGIDHDRVSGHSYAVSFLYNAWRAAILRARPAGACRNLKRIDNDVLGLVITTIPAFEAGLFCTIQSSVY
jgi:hypothetical protein